MNPAHLRAQVSQIEIVVLKNKTTSLLFVVLNESGLSTEGFVGVVKQRRIDMRQWRFAWQGLTQRHMLMNIKPKPQIYNTRIYNIRDCYTYAYSRRLGARQADSHGLYRLMILRGTRGEDASAQSHQCNVIKDAQNCI